MKELAVYLWVTADSRFVGRLIIEMASKGHLKTHKLNRTAQEGGLAPHALFDANTTSDAKELGDERDFVGGLHLNTEFTCMTVTRLIPHSCATSTDPF